MALGGITLLLMVIVAVVMYSLLNYGPSVNEKTHQAQMTRLQSSARIYHSRLTFYDGVCSDIGVETPYRCIASEEAYAIEVRLPDRSYYCADSTGFLGKTTKSFDRGTACIQE